MKKLYILAAAALTLGATSCDDTLDKQPLDEIVSNIQYWSNDDNVVTQCNRLYNNYSGYGNGQGTGSFYFNALSDDQTDNGFANWAFTNVPASASAWRSPFTELRGINEIIVNVREAHPGKETYFEGVARMNRAYQYYQLVRAYGDVQWVNEPIKTDDKEKVYGKRTDRDIVMDSVLRDLDYAIATIGKGANKYSWSSDMAAAMKAEICLYEGTFCKYRTAADNGKAADQARANKYLQEAANAANIILSSGNYSLTGAYGEIYNSLNLSGCSEIIFYKPYSQPNASFGHGTIAYTSSSTAHKGITKDAFNAFLFLDGKPLASTSRNKSDKAVLVDGKFNISALLAERDKRLAVIVEPVLGLNGYELQRDPSGQYMTSSTGYCIAKFNNLSLNKTQRETIGQNTTCAPLFWLAKVMLDYAEAKAELGTLTQDDVNKTLNLLNARAGLPNFSLTPAADPANNMGVSNLIWEVRRARRCELMLDGFRFFDLIRWHQLDKLDSKNHPDIFLGANVGDVAISDATVEGYVRTTPDKERVYANKYYLYPVPSGQITLNPNLEQNPLWK